METLWEQGEGALSTGALGVVLESGRVTPGCYVTAVCSWALDTVKIS